MKCPACGGVGSKVLETRVAGDALRRRRVCACGHRFSTVETCMVSPAVHVSVQPAPKTAAPTIAPKPISAADADWFDDNNNFLPEVE